MGRSPTKKYYWLKLKADFFDDKRVKRIRKEENGDTLTIIYLKMLLKSIKESGCIFYDGIEDSITDELALELDEEPDHVAKAFDMLVKMDLLEIYEGEQKIYLPVAEECTGSETDAAERMRKMRSKKEECNNVTKELRECSQKLHRDRERERDRDRDRKASAGADAGQSPPDLKPSKTKTKNKVEEVDIEVITDYFGNDKVNLVFNEFLKARKELKIKNTPRAVKLLVDKLQPYPAEVQYNAITESIMNSWKGVFPKNSDKQDSGTGNPFLDMLIENGGNLDD